MPRYELKESGDYARAIVETMRDPLLILGGDLRVKSANQSFYDTFQVTPEQTENQFLYELGEGNGISLHCGHCWTISSRAALRSRTSRSSTSFPASGEESCSSMPAGSSSKTAARTRSCWRFADITDRKGAERLLRQSEERFHSIVTQVTAGIAQTDFTGRFVLVNQRFCEIVGYSHEELYRMRMQDITHPADVSKNMPLFPKLAASGRDFVIETRYTCKDGSLVWVNNSVSTVRDSSGKPQGLVAVVIDITNRKRAEEALEQADHRKNEFLAMLAHELRNPLSAISNAVQLLGWPEADMAAFAWSKEVIERQVENLVRLVDDLLDVCPHHPRQDPAT